MNGMIRLLLPVGIVFTAACNFNVPFDPTQISQPVDNLVNGINDAIDNALADPLGAKPFPVLIGGDNQRVLYATNLTDTRINFPGPTNDIVLPGFTGPSNLYQFASRQRDLIRPLIPGGTFLGLTTDGEFVAFVSASGDPDPGLRIVASRVESLELETIYNDAFESLAVLPMKLALSDGRLAFPLFDENNDSYRLRVQDLTGAEPTLELELAELGAFELRGDRLAYVARDDFGFVNVVVRDLATDAEATIAENLRVDSPFEVAIAIAANRVVWSVPSSGVSTSDVSAYDLTDGTTRTIAEAALGSLSGANDQYFVTEEYVVRLPQAADRYKVRRYDENGNARVLAEFRADGLAGQTRVVGDRAAWVNPDREVVLAPLAGGDRTIFKPF